MGTRALIARSWQTLPLYASLAIMFTHNTFLFVLLHATVQRAAAWSTIPCRGLGKSGQRLWCSQLHLSQEDLLHEDDAAPPVTTANLPTKTMTNNDYMLALGTSPRRILLSGLAATTIALTGNLFGVTSQLLTILPEDAVESSGLDTYFPRGKNAETRQCTLCLLWHLHFDSLRTYRRIQEMQWPRLFICISNRMGSRYLCCTGEGPTSDQVIRLSNH